jgi:hypothetical protein
MGAQGFYSVIAAGEFGLAQGGVDFIVADLVQEHGWPALAALEAGDQMMMALACLGRDRAATEGANRVWQRVFLESI